MFLCDIDLIYIYLLDILREFNPAVKGFSLGSGNKDSAGANLNVAEAGDIAQ